MGFLTTITKTFMSLLLILITTIATRIIYRIYFHPLSSSPGPALYASSRLPLFYHSIRGDSVRLLTQLHIEYGPVVRIAPNELSYTTDTAWKTIYGHRGQAEEMAKDLRGAGLTRPPNGEHGILTADRENHARMRRLISHAFSEKALREQEGFLLEYVDLLVKGLRENAAKGSVDLVTWYNWTTFDVIGDLAFGSSFSCLSTQAPDPWITSLFTAIRIVPYIQALMYYNLLWLLKYIVPKKMLLARARTQASQKEKLASRLALGPDAAARKDFLSYILRHNEAAAAKEEGVAGMTANEKGKEALTQGEIFTNSSLLIIAGSETTATLLSGVTWHLLRRRNCRVYAKLCGEIRGAFQSAEDITMKNVNELRYLTAVLEEGMRIYPPAPAAFPRVVPRGGEVVDGRFVPGGTTVGVHQYATYHSPLNFHRPLSFHPERWLPECTNDPSSPYYHDNRAAFQPFAIGPRACIGRNLALAEMRLVLARVLWEFDLSLDEEVYAEEAAGRGDGEGGINTREDKEENEGVGAWQEGQSVFLIWNKGPLMVNLVPRR